MANESRELGAFTRVRIDKKTKEEVKKLAAIQMRTEQDELRYLLMVGLRSEKANIAVAEGKSQIDLAALRGLAQREGVQG